MLARRSTRDVPSVKAHAQDHRPVAESPAPWNPQGRMGLHLCDNRLQPGTHAKPSDSGDVSQGWSLSAGFERQSLSTSNAAKLFFSHEIEMPGKNLSRAVRFSASF